MPFLGRLLPARSTDCAALVKHAHGIWGTFTQFTELQVMPFGTT